MTTTGPPRAAAPSDPAPSQAPPSPSDGRPRDTAPVTEPADRVADPDCAEDLGAVLASLLEDLRFAELAEALRSVDALAGPDRARAVALTRAGARLLRLDAAAFADVDGLPTDIAPQVRAMGFPTSAVDPGRGSLESLRPLYGLMLEALEVHWARDEMAMVAVILHLVGEYLPVLAWEPVLGHAADPLRLRHQVAGTLWATAECPMPRHRRSAAERVVALDPDGPGGGIHAEQWRSYLDRWHSRVSGALRQCALRPGAGRPNPDDAGCDRPCGVVTRLPAPVLDDLAARMALATAFAESPLVRLRHQAPVGHFFGVPGQDDVSAAWAETVTWIGRDWRGEGPGGGNPAAGGLVARDGEPLPGLEHLLSIVAGVPVTPTVVLHTLRDQVTTLLGNLLPELEPSTV